jgi:GNAT superfamily N-acetyltransferase
VRIREVSFDDPDAQRLIAEVQQEYVLRYGGQDRTPTDATEFAAPRGTFVVGYLDGRAVACGGWRAHDGDEPDFHDGDAELKRMYVVPAARGLGLSRQLLADLEHRAAAAGRRRLVLETGTKQPEAIGLYRSADYVEIPKFGVFRCEPDSRCFGKELPIAALVGDRRCGESLPPGR